MTKWTIEKIKSGFEQFYKENGRLPTAPEIDSLPYLPSSRQIQRGFGGLERLRKKLGYEQTNFGRGIFRSNIATKSNKQGRDSEIKLEKILKEKFHEVFVHTEKIFDDTKNRVDFYIYSPDGNFGIDIFHTGTMRDLQKNINLKINKYKKFPETLYFVVDSKEFTQEMLDASIKNKIRELPVDTYLKTIDAIIEIIKNKKAYQSPF